MATLAELQALVVDKTDKMAKIGYRLDKKTKNKIAIEQQVIELQAVCHSLTTDINVLTTGLESAQQALITAIIKLCNHSDYTDV
jgi:hypothetical protein